jgi:hypothetical protein
MRSVLELAACLRRQAALALLLVAVAVRPSAGQDATADRQPEFTIEEMEALLLKGRITDRKGTSKGVTDAFRVTLSDGQRTHDAQVQNVDIFRTVFEVAPKHTEFNFRDTYRYNVAAYLLARLLGLQNVPVSVPRIVDGKPAAVTWWIDEVAMDEGGRLKLSPRERLGPNPSRTSAYIHVLRVFDELIQNRDRNAGNLLWTKDWTMWMIDHTRAFRTDPELRNPQLLERCERTLFASLRSLTRETLTKAVGNNLLQPEIDAVLARRDRVVKLFEDKIARAGEAAVLYTLPR